MSDNDIMQIDEYVCTPKIKRHSKSIIKY